MPYVNSMASTANKMNNYVTRMKSNVRNTAVNFGNKLVDGEEALTNGIMKSLFMVPKLVFQLQRKGLEGFTKLMDLMPSSSTDVNINSGDTTQQYYDRMADNQHYSPPSMASPYPQYYMQGGVQQRPPPSNVASGQNQSPGYQPAIVNPVGPNPPSALQPIRSYHNNDFN